MIIQYIVKIIHTIIVLSTFNFKICYKPPSKDIYCQCVRVSKIMILLFFSMLSICFQPTSLSSRAHEGEGSSEDAVEDRVS